MADKTFSIGEALRFGWKTARSNLLFFAGLLLVVGVVSFIANLIPIIGPLFSVFLWMGILRVALNLVDGRPAGLKDLYSDWRKFGWYLGAAIMVTLIVVGGFILFIIPGIIWSIKYSMSPYLIVDKNMKVMEAVKKSGELTRGVKWELFALAVILTVINWLGVLALLIGLFITVPLSVVAMVYVYRKLLEQTEQAATLTLNAPPVVSSGPGMNSV